MDRNFLDSTLPDNNNLKRIASDITNNPDINVIYGLQWLVDFEEKDRIHFLNNPIRNIRIMDWFYIICNGINYKSSNDYLTNEGWPLGTKCWYITIEHLYKSNITAETIETAVYRAIIVVECLKRFRNALKEDRRDIEDYIREFMIEQLSVLKEVSIK